MCSCRFSNGIGCSNPCGLLLHHTVNSLQTNNNSRHGNISKLRLERSGSVEIKEGEKMANMTGDNLSESEMLHALLQKNVQRVTDLEKNVDSFFVVVISIIIFCEYCQQYSEQ